MPAYTADLSADAVAYYARRADAIAKGPHVYGGPWTVDTRALLRYHRNALQELTLAGKVRSLTHKQMAIAGAVARISVTQEHATITSIAKEANCVPSTASRFLLKLQAWHAYAIDVTRGRNGGVTVRLRKLGDRLEAYAQRAWTRIRLAAERALSRTNRNVASTSFGGNGYDLEVPEPTTVVMDATFSDDPLVAVRHLHPSDPFRKAVVKQLRDQKRVEHAGAMVTTGEWSIDYAQAWYDAQN